MFKNLIAGALFFFSVTVFLVAQQYTGVTMLGTRLGAQAGTGDVVGPSSSVDSEIALFSGTTGKLIKRATGSGLVTAASGVYGVQTAGTVGNCVQWASGGLLGDAGAACGSGAGTSYSAGDGIGISSSTISVDTTVPAVAISGSQSLTFGTISSGSMSTQTMTVRGAAVGDTLMMGWPATMPDGCIPYAFVSATDTVTVRIYKATSGSASITGLTFYYQVLRTR